MDIDKAKELLNKASDKSKEATKKVKAVSKTPGIWWEVGAYATRTISVVTPATIIMTLEDSWVKNGLGLLATLLIIAVLIIFKDPIKKASGYAPGVIPFAIFVVVAIFFDTTSKSLLTIGISGLSGCTLAIPMHIKYLSCQKQVKSPELEALETIAAKLK